VYARVRKNEKAYPNALIDFGNYIQFDISISSTSPPSNFATSEAENSIILILNFAAKIININYLVRI